MKKLIFFSMVLVFSVMVTYRITRSTYECSAAVPAPESDLIQTAYATGRNATYLHFLELECEKSHPKTRMACDSMKEQISQLDLKYHYDQMDK